MKLKFIIIFVLLVNVVFAGTGSASDVNLIIGFFVIVLFVIVGIFYFSKFISRRREERKIEHEGENPDYGEE